MDRLSFETKKTTNNVVNQNAKKTQIQQSHNFECHCVEVFVTQ